MTNDQILQLVTDCGGSAGEVKNGIGETVHILKFRDEELQEFVQGIQAEALEKAAQAVADRAANQYENDTNSFIEAIRALSSPPAGRQGGQP